MVLLEAMAKLHQKTLKPSFSVLYHSPRLLRYLDLVLHLLGLQGPIRTLRFL